jgi:hypothetical protein
MNGEWVSTEHAGYLINREGDVFNEKSGRLLKAWLMTNGYWAVTIHGDGRKTCYVHRLMAKAFLPNPDSKPFVNHINGLKSDNSLANLEWCTHAENMAHARETGLSTSHLRANQAMVAATRKPVEQICIESGSVIAVFDGLQCAMRETGLSSIRRCVSGIQAATGGFAWRYKVEGKRA